MLPRLEEDPDSSVLIPIVVMPFLIPAITQTVKPKL